MGKKIRIVLLTVTAVAAVFSFALMLDVRPGSDSTVLNAAKDRQSEPLLSVSEPLETDPGTIAAEEEMAEKVKGILLADDEFIGSISDQIYDGVPEMVNSWLAGEEGAAILQTLQDNGVDEAVARIVTEENINAIAERVASNLGTNDSEAFAAAADRLARTVASQIIIPQIQREVARNTVIELYNANKDVIADDVIRRAVAEYASLTDAEKLELLSLDSIYYKYSDGMFADALKALEALPAEEKARIISFAETADKYYQENLPAVVEDIKAALGPEETIDVEKEVLDLYDKYRSALVSDMVADILAQYDALTTEEKKDVLGIDIESEVLALYDKYSTALAEDIAAYISANYPDEEIDIESEILALYEKYKTGLAEDVIAYWNGNSPAVMSVSPDIESEVLALYDKYRTALVSDIIVDILNEYDALSAEEKAELLGVEGISEQEILDLYEKYRTGLAEDVIAYWNENYPDEPVVLEDEILTLYEKYRTALAEDVIAYENANYPDAETDVEAAILALYPIYRTALAEDMVSYFRNAYPEQDVRAEAVALYDEYKTQIAEDVASYIQENYPAEEPDIESEVVSLYEANKTQIAEDIAQYILANYPAEEIDVRAEAEAVYEEYKDEIINAVISYIDENYQKPVSSWTPISNPSFSSGPILPEDAGLDEYQRVRSDIRQSEAARVSSLFAE